MPQLLYITFVDLSSSHSGSSVRPRKMLESFQSLGYEIKLLEGIQNKRKQRRKNVREILNWLENNKPDICYVEPPSGPFFNTIDLRLLIKLKKMGVPIGLFYRDIYWKYPTPYKNIKESLKLFIIKIMHLRDLYVFRRTLSIFFTPTEDLGHLVQLPSQIEKKTLPPGTFIPKSYQPNLNQMKPVGIYVGGLAEMYGVKIMLAAAQSLVDKGYDFTIKLICRENEWLSFKKDNQFIVPIWLEVLHLSGDELLKQQYQQADFALCPHETGGYNEITLSVKFMEYISYLLPIVVTNTKSMSKIVEQYDIGEVTEYTLDSYASGMLKLIENASLREKYRKNCLKAREENLWIHRAKEVVSLLEFKQ